MVELSRRFFLGGAISLLAVSTSAIPKSFGNMPQIFGDGRRDDTHGLGALFRSEPVIVAKDKITIEAHKGITFHGGEFKITRTLEIPDELDLSFAGRPIFLGHELADDEPFFVAGGKHTNNMGSYGIANVWFRHHYKHGPLVNYISKAKRDPRWQVAENGDVYMIGA